MYNMLEVEIVTYNDDLEGVRREKWSPPDGITTISDVAKIWDVCIRKGLWVAPSILYEVWGHYSAGYAAGWMESNSLSDDEIYEIVDSILRDVDVMKMLLSE